MYMTQEYISTKHELLDRIIIEVKCKMSESKNLEKEEFWLFHDLEEQEIVELRKFIDPELDFSSLKGIDKLFDKLNHLLD